MKRGIQTFYRTILVLCLCLMTLCSTVWAASGSTTYVLAFSAGSKGSFRSGAANYLNQYGTVKTGATGNLYVELSAGSAFPSEILTYLQAEDGYYYKGGLSGETVTGDATYVAQCGVLKGKGVLYTVQYVDARSGAEVAESYTGYANAGDTISFSGKVVNGYQVDAGAKTLTVQNGAVLNFYYTGSGSGETITQYVKGEDRVITDTVTNETNNGQTTGTGTQSAVNQAGQAGNTGGTAANGTTAATTADGEQGNGTGTEADDAQQGTGTIPDNDTPKDNGETEQTETIEDNEVPLEKPAAEKSTLRQIVIPVAAGVILLVAIGVLIWLKKGKKKVS